MAFNISEELKLTFGPAAILGREAAKILNGKEWKEYQEITRKFADQKRFEQRAYDLEYKTRVEVARKRLINQAGEKNRDFKHRWFGNDRFDKSAINRQAHRQVQNQHTRLLTHLENKELGEIDALLDRSEHRHLRREKPRRDFEYATNRRSGAERRNTKPHTRIHSRDR